MLSGIMAIELKMLDWQCNAKLNQHRPESRVYMLASYIKGGPSERVLAQWMERFGLTLQ